MHFIKIQLKKIIKSELLIRKFKKKTEKIV